jgi:hypothetical protein
MLVPAYPGPRQIAFSSSFSFVERGSETTQQAANEA